MASRTSRLVGSFGCALLALAWVGCGAQEETETSATRAAVVKPSKAHFSQVLRVNPGPTRVRNLCELTLVRDDDRPMTIEATGTGGSSVTVGWTGNAIAIPELEVDACADPPCEVLIRWEGTGASGAAMGCQIAVDDATARVVGTSTGTALTVFGSASDPIVFNQDVKLPTSGPFMSGSAVFRHGSVLADARISDFEVSVDGSLAGTLPDQTAIGVSWRQKDLSIDFGSVVRGEDDSATRLKHIAPLKEQLDPGQALRYRGTFLEDAGTELFNVNVENAPVGLGMTLTTPPSLWTCDPALFGSGGACDCNCGLFDPDCATVNELCDGVDNDCNPLTADGSDEDVIESPTPCDDPVVDSDSCEEGVYSCADGDIVCNEAAPANDNTSNDVEHCGGCDMPCETTNASSVTCSAFACVPVCQADWQSCDNNNRNGCETTRVSGATCNAPVSLGPFNGDDLGTHSTRTGFAEAAYTALFKEDDLGDDNANGVIDFTNPADATFRLCAYCLSCQLTSPLYGGGPPPYKCTTPARGATETLEFGRADDTFGDDDVLLYIEIDYVSGNSRNASCGHWTMQLRSLNGTSDCTCESTEASVANGCD